MKKPSLGFSVIELMIVIGLIAVVSLGTMSLVNNVMKGVASAQRGANRTETMKAISTVLSNKETCKSALGAGTLEIGSTWGLGSTIPINKIQVGSDVIAEVGVTKNDILITEMKLENIFGPNPVQYNTTTAPALPIIKNFTRYFAKLKFTSEKKGGAANNVGGEKLKENELLVAFLVDDTGKLFGCSGGLDEADTSAFCENGFDGEYDSTKYPWCTPRTMGIGINQSSMLPEPPRFTVLEKQSPSNSVIDITMVLLGNGVGGNGPGLWWAQPSGQGAVIALSNRPGAFGPSSTQGNFVIGNNTMSKDLQMHVTKNISGVATQIPALTIKSDGNVGIGTTAPEAKLDVAGGIRPGSAGVTTGGGCSPEGVFAYDMAAHAPVYCNASGIWASMGGGNFSSCITVGSAS